MARAENDVTDEQLIERVRRGQRYRRPLGAVFALVGILMAVGILYWVYDLWTNSLSTWKELNDTMYPTTQQVEEALDHAQFNWGLALGFSLATGLTAGAVLATSGVVLLLVPNRKDKLLLRCWEVERVKRR